MASPRRVALMLELGKSDYWHAELFAGTQRYARESGNWDCHIDEFVQDRLPSRRGRNVPYDGIIAWATPELAEGARRCGVPLVNGSPICRPSSQILALWGDWLLNIFCSADIVASVVFRCNVSSANACSWKSSKPP